MSNPFADPIKVASPKSANSTSGNTENVNRKTPWLQTFAGAGLAFIGSTVFAVGVYFSVFKNPASAPDQDFGLLMWIVGSSLLGGGFTFVFCRVKVSVLVGLLAPSFTLGLAFVLYWGTIILYAFS